MSKEVRERPDMGKESSAFKMMTAEQRVGDRSSEEEEWRMGRRRGERRYGDWRTGKQDGQKMH